MKSAILQCLQQFFCKNSKNVYHDCYEFECFEER